MKKKKILFLYPGTYAEIVADVHNGSAPKERLYGMYELRENGWDVSYNDSRFTGFANSLNKYTKIIGIEFLGWKLMRDIVQSDIVLIKDDFSICLTLFCKMFGKPVIYFDSLFNMPNNVLRKFLLKLNIKLATRIISYSHFQRDLWCSGDQKKSSKFAVVPYAIDVGFYKLRKAAAKVSSKPYILAVGRDMGRDYATLTKAAAGLDIGLKLVTLPYLLEGVTTEGIDCDVYQYLSYDELFELYMGALLVVVPLKQGVQYPSGIRGALEAMSLGKAVIMTRTPVMEEYFEDNVNILFVDPASPDDLGRAIKRLQERPEARDELIKNAKMLVQTRYQQNKVIGEIEAIINRC